MKYPNLAEVIKYHPYNICAFADFADATTELLSAVIEGTENLTERELRGIARYSGIPFGILACPRLIRMDKYRYRHRAMVEELVNSLYGIQEAQKSGSKEADLFMRSGCIWVVNMELTFLNGRATYGMYLGSKERVEQVQLFIANERRKPRGLEERAAG